MQGAAHKCQRAIGGPLHGLIVSVFPKNSGSSPTYLEIFKFVIRFDCFGVKCNLQKQQMQAYWVVRTLLVAKDGFVSLCLQFFFW